MWEDKCLPNIILNTGVQFYNLLFTYGSMEIDKVNKKHFCNFFKHVAGLTHYLCQSTIASQDVALESFAAEYKKANKYEIVFYVA